MSQLNLVLTAIGVLVLFLGLLSDYFRRSWWASDPLISLLLGILLGPAVGGVLQPTMWGLPQEMILEQAARFTLAIGLMGVALRLPKGYIFHHWRSLSILLGIVMPVMWIVSGLLIYGILSVPFWEGMLMGAILTPTDPIVASSIVTGALAESNLPPRIRHIISAESGANDGLAYPFVLLCILVLTRSPANTLSHWLLNVVLWDVVGAVVLGALMGYGAAVLLQWAERKKTIEQQSFLGYTVALSITVLGAAKLMGTDGVLAVFISGLAFDSVIEGQERLEEENVQEAINRFFTLPIFLLLGLLIPWQQWWALGWQGGLLAIGILLLRRPPVILLLKNVITPLRSSPDSWFAASYMGWFGPIGVAAIYYAGYAMKHTQVEDIWTVCSLVICASIVVHGLSASPLTRLYGKIEETNH